MPAPLPARCLLESARSGAGERADWEEAARARATRRELVLAGGLDAANVAEAIARVRPFGVDVSSGVESGRGVKDAAQIREFVAARPARRRRSRIDRGESLMRTEALKIDRDALLAQTLRGAFPDAARPLRPVRRTLRARDAGARRSIGSSKACAASCRDPAFQRRARVASCAPGSGRPTPLTSGARAVARWGAEVWLKREDLAHTGAHKINNAIGQALLAKRLGAKRIVAETGAGQHGVATAAACARLGMPCTVYMGAIDMERQAPNVGRMKLLGAEVVPVTGGDQTLRAAIDEALRDWVVRPERHVLPARLGRRAASVSVHGARVPVA